MLRTWISVGPSFRKCCIDRPKSYLHSAQARAPDLRAICLFPAPHNMHLDMLSWNVHGPPLAPHRATRLNAVGLEIERRTPEIALLQEVWFRRDAAALASQLAAQYDVLDGAPRMRPVRTGGLLGFVRRNSDWRLADHGLRFEPFAVHASRWRVWEGDALGGKGIQIIPLVHRPSGRSIVIVHTHVQAQYAATQHTRPRRAQLAQLARL